MAQRGRKSKWKTHVEPKLATITAWSRDGLDDYQIAKNLGVAVSTFSKYKTEFPELKDALKIGRVDALAHVENSQFKAACGYDYEETKVVYDVDDKGKPSKVSKVEKMKKHVKPDIGAGCFILVNRSNGKWRHVQHILQKFTNDLDEYTEEELEKALEELK